MHQNQEVLPLSPEACMELLATTGIGRVILTEQAMPTALPVAFAVDNGAIIFRSCPGASLPPRPAAR